MSSFRSIPTHALSEGQAKAELELLSSELLHHDKLYFQDDAPVITDAEYDALAQRNKDIEQRFPHLIQKNTRSQRVGTKIISRFPKAKHLEPMLSLENVFSEEDLTHFLKRMQKGLSMTEGSNIQLMAEPKIDGLSLALTYQNGQLIRGTTRGDGTTGEDITHNVKTIADIPHTISHESSDPIEVRGEVYMNTTDFQKLNRQREKEGSPLFANPRNGAAGSLRQLDAQVTALRPLKFFAYSLIAKYPLKETQEDTLKLLCNWGFKTSRESKLCNHLQDLMDYYHHLKNMRYNLPYEIDGIVYKANLFSHQKQLGFIARAPKWAIAHKFPAEQAETVLKKITINVGRTGVLTPLAELEPVAIGGVWVSKATLHNQDEIQRKDIREGDKVLLQRAGDVIPQIVKSLPHNDRSEPFHFPSTCPACGSHTAQELDEAAIRCTGGLTCPAQTVERLKHFISKHAFNIDGLGGKRIDYLWAKNLVKRPSDIFTLEMRNKSTLTPLQNHQGWGRLSVENLFESINEKRNISLDRFLYALGIHHVGRVNAANIAQHYQSFQNMWNEVINMDNKVQDSLMGIEGVGHIVAASLINFFSEVHNQEEIKALIPHLNIVNINSTPPKNDHPFYNKVMVFTGTLSGLSRDEAQALTKEKGAKITNSLSKKTDYLVYGEAAGSKLDKAKKLGVTLLSETQWWNQLDA